jgi:uncharacterized membrane protein YoaK (UPF0700 family)
VVASGKTNNVRQIADASRSARIDELTSAVMPITSRRGPALADRPTTAGPASQRAPDLAGRERRESGFVPSPAARMSNDRLRVGLLSAVAGYVDAAGFVSLLGLFPAHLTGEIVGITLSVSSGSPLRMRVLALPVFVGAVVLAVLVARMVRRRGRPPLLALLGLMALALSLFTATGFAFPELAHASHPVPVLLLSAVAAMAFQNTFMREAAGAGCPTTVMTGNLTAFVIELVDLFLTRASKDPEQLSAAEHAKGDARLKLVATALFGFTFGAGVGGWLTGIIGPRSMLLPTIAVFYLVFRARRES